MPTWFLKEVCWTGSSAAREMLLSRMKKRIRLVNIVSLTMRWHWRRNLHRKEEERDVRKDKGRQTPAPPVCLQKLVVGVRSGP